jgi:hypothetical protein
MVCHGFSACTGGDGGFDVLNTKKGATHIPMKTAAAKARARRTFQVGVS